MRYITKTTWEYDWAIDENTGVREIITIDNILATKEQIDTSYIIYDIEGENNG